MMTLLKDIKCYFGCSKPPDVDGVKLFDEDDQAIKHCSFYLNVLHPGNDHQIF